LPFWKHWRTGLAAIAILGLSLYHGNADSTSIFDLTWDGPETSTVDECVDGDFFCITLPITGSLGVGLELDAPYLVNVESDILLPPQTPNSRPVISPNLWHNFDLLEGEYLSTDSDDEVSMVFRPAAIGGQLRAYTIFATITNGGQSFELTGGIEQSATSPLEPDVRFSVSGRLIVDNSGADDLVDGSDFLALQRGYNSHAAGVATDMTGDGIVTAADFTLWRAEYGTVRGSSASSSIQTVPEPNSVTLAFLVSIAVSTCLSRRRGGIA